MVPGIVEGAGLVDACLIGQNRMRVSLLAEPVSSTNQIEASRVAIVLEEPSNQLWTISRF